MQPIICIAAGTCSDDATPKEAERRLSKGRGAAGYELLPAAMLSVLPPAPPATLSS